VIIETETKTDHNELKALCTLIGPYGVRVIDKELLDVIKANVGTVKDILSRVRPVLEPLKGRFTDREAWNVARKRIADGDLDTLIHRSTIIGCVLAFRNILRQALAHVNQTSVPNIFETVKLAFDHTHDIYKSAPTEFEPLDFLASDCGIDVSESDNNLKLTLKEYKQTPADATVWSLLPELYGMAMTAPRWKTAKYTIQVEGHMNNAHTIALTIRSLIANFNIIGVTSMEGVDARIQGDMERFVHCAANSLLHNALTMRAPSLCNDSMILLEQFILQCTGRLYLSILEECFPFTLIRTNFIRIYEQQSSKGRRYAIQQEEEKEAA